MSADEVFSRSLDKGIDSVEEAERNEGPLVSLKLY